MLFKSLHSLILVGLLPIVWAQDWNMPVDAPNPVKRGDQYWGQVIRSNGLTALPK